LINICIHGHFYQPPRENPWTGEIEKQDSAAPYHDWNEKVFSECYEPNTEAHIINDKGEVIKKINNYEYINFNFGPTLFSWIKEKHPDTYTNIIEADKRSIIRHNGHGNAIAMAYNHIILPLANLQDKITQIKWGLRDFEYHFERKSESIWLPETACNWDTIEILISEKIKYIILDVGQAERIRKFGDAKWQGVTGGSIDPKMPYRCFSRLNRKKFIDIFFYDGPVSKAVAFDDVLQSSANLLGKIVNAVPPGSIENPIVSVATDGETFGHHKKFAERTLAYFLTVHAPANSLRIVNYAEYIEEHPPTHEVEIKKGKNGEGTSWSCPHGVDRWKDDCGCGGGGSWHQRWRKPMREAMNWLRDQLILIYEKEGNKYFKDIWQARNDYIDLILEKSDSRINMFFEKNAKRILTHKEIDTCFKLLEMQKNSMLMFTSCGWFFSEISGLEAVQVLQYAAKAIETAHQITGKSLEREFKKKLALAESNIKKYKDGRGVYNKLVKTAKKISITVHST
jgi:alpha-amylase/alpha-mannosidase (GH57 family)